MGSPDTHVGIPGLYDELFPGGNGEYWLKLWVEYSGKFIAAKALHRRSPAQVGLSRHPHELTMGMSNLGGSLAAGTMSVNENVAIADEPGQPTVR